MDLNLKNKKALVMGSSTGIGKAIAASLISEGATVAICARNKERLVATASEIKADCAITCDLSQEGSAEKLIDDVTKEFGKIDILVTNTGGPKRGTFQEISKVQWRTDFQSLWMSTVDAINAVLPSMMQNKWGRIILITSVAAKEPINGLTTSNGLRAGLLGLIKSISNEFAQYGITINSILPGYTDTDRLRKLKVPQEKMTAQIPAKRLAHPNELGDLAAFLASERAAYISGQSIAIDGGFLKGQ